MKFNPLLIKELIEVINDMQASINKFANLDPITGLPISKHKEPLLSVKGWVTPDELLQKDLDDYTYQIMVSACLLLGIVQMMRGDVPSHNLMDRIIEAIQDHCIYFNERIESLYRVFEQESKTSIKELNEIARQIRQLNETHMALLNGLMAMVSKNQKEDHNPTFENLTHNLRNLFNN
jgi:hypothetical protein